MHLDLLQPFAAVAEAASFSVAATKLGLRRSSVSRAVAALERELGVQLFHRTTRNVALTTAGAALYANVAPALASLRQAIDNLPERHRGPAGVLRVSAPNDFGAAVLAPALAGFAQAFPSVSVDVRLTSRRVDVVTEGFDAALRLATSRLADSSLVARRLTNIEMQLFAAPSYLARAGTPRTPKQTESHQWVSMHALRAPKTFALAKAWTPIVADDVLFVCEAVRAGAGLGLLPTFLARDDLTHGRLVRVLPRFTVKTGWVYLVYPPAAHVPQKVVAFRDYLVDYFATHPLST